MSTPAPTDHADCPSFLREGMRQLGVAIVVSTEPPVVLSPYTTEPFTCPHGTTYWIEPTGGQIAEWARTGER